MGGRTGTAAAPNGNTGFTGIGLPQGGQTGAPQGNAAKPRPDRPTQTPNAPQVVDGVINVGDALNRPMGVGNGGGPMLRDHQLSPGAGVYIGKGNRPRALSYNPANPVNPNQGLPARPNAGMFDQLASLGMFQPGVRTF